MKCREVEGHSGTHVPADGDDARSVVTLISLFRVCYRIGFRSSRLPPLFDTRLNAIPLDKREG